MDLNSMWTKVCFKTSIFFIWYQLDQIFTVNPNLNHVIKDTT